MKLLTIISILAAAYLLAARPAERSGLSGVFAAQPGRAATRPAAASASTGGLTSNPIGIGGDPFGQNIRCALDANGGALRSFVVAPGQTWSFNAAMGTGGASCAVAVAGVLGGGWCNLAARYAQAARAAGLAVAFEDHGLGDLGGGSENSVAIWNVDGTAGSDGDRQDLEIRNPTGRAVRFRVVEMGSDAVAVEATAQ